jgi:hypothetical protein
MSLEPWQQQDLKAHWEEITRLAKEKHVPNPTTKDFPVAIKHDGLKPRFDLLPWDALAEVCKVYQFGKHKYSARNWEKGFDWLRLWNAAMRHMTVWESGEDHDPETKLSHTVHAAFCILGLIAHELRGIGTDNRHRPVAQPTVESTSPPQPNQEDGFELPHKRLREKVRETQEAVGAKDPRLD